jgi:hypothetical protein
VCPPEGSGKNTKIAKKRAPKECDDSDDALSDSANGEDADEQPTSKARSTRKASHPTPLGRTLQARKKKSEQRDRGSSSSRGVDQTAAAQRQAYNQAQAEAAMRAVQASIAQSSSSTRPTTGIKAPRYNPVDIESSPASAGVYHSDLDSPAIRSKRKKKRSASSDEEDDDDVEVVKPPARKKLKMTGNTPTKMKPEHVARAALMQRESGLSQAAKLRAEIAKYQVHS